MAGGVPEEVGRRAREVLAGLSDRDVDLFLARLRRWWHDLAEGLGGPYGDRHDLAALLERITVLLAERYRERDEELKLLDLERSLRPDWFQDPAMVGYVCYADRFAAPWPGSASASTTSASWGSATCT
jgi:amylosucrase